MKAKAKTREEWNDFSNVAAETSIVTPFSSLPDDAEGAGVMGKFLSSQTPLMGPSRLNALSTALELAAIFLVGWHCWNNTSEYLLQTWCGLMIALVAFRFIFSEIKKSRRSSGFEPNEAAQNPSLSDVAVNLGWTSLVLLPQARGISPAFLVLLLMMVLMARVLMELWEQPHQLKPFCFFAGLPITVLLIISGKFEAWASAGILLTLCWGAQQILTRRQTLADRRKAMEDDYREARREAGDMAFRVAATEETLQAALNNVSCGIAICDKNMRFSNWNSNFARLLDINPEWMSTSRTVLDIVSYHAEQGEYDDDDVESAYLKAKQQFTKVLEAGRSDTEILRPNGAVCHVLSVRLPGDRVMSVYTDISEGKKLTTDALVHLSQHDSLTGLSNRVKFRRDLEKTIGQAKRSGALVSVMMLNLDHFKDINDTLGHAAGDEILCAIARRISACTRKNDTVARLGGDEFAIISTSNKTIDDAVLMAKRFLRAIAKPIDFNNKPINMGASIGISVFPNDTDGTDHVARAAELALARAKHEGRNNYQLYDSGLHLELQARAAMERDIREAMKTQEFAFHYQPQIDLKTKRVIGIEALMRWHHPERGWVPPDQFIPVAEETSLIIPLTESLLPDACREISKLRKQGFDDMTVAVNLSPLHFKTEGLLNFVSDTLRETGLDPKYLELEITEGMVMQDSEKVIETLTELDQLGIKVSIDDFGTGYSSLSYLKKFPVDKLKIDKSFIRDVPFDKGAVAIVEAVIKLGHSFNLKIIAEGVETQEQIDFLETLGCDEVQGYYYSKALPSKDLALWLEDNFIIEPSLALAAD
jgi:diguanylate cyclase (GGDEF)-like protein